VHLIEKYFGISLGDVDGPIEALILVVLFMLITTVALWVGQTKQVRKKLNN
jgi:hypothetical protein